MLASAYVKEARLRAGLTQAELARRAGTSQPTLARYERGAVVPSIATLERLLAACGLELSVRLVDIDPSYDENIDSFLKLSPEARLQSAVNMAEFTLELRRGTRA